MTFEEYMKNRKDGTLKSAWNTAVEETKKKCQRAMCEACAENSIRPSEVISDCIMSEGACEQYKAIMSVGEEE